eukprot:maker-scaffold_2-snap-gene-18.4-mRNA-1 protein AED:0.23 eAED:0.23 QI:135/1/1/1/0/0.5/2/154/454
MSSETNETQFGRFDSGVTTRSEVSSALSIEAMDQKIISNMLNRIKQERSQQQSVFQTQQESTVEVQEDQQGEVESTSTEGRKDLSVVDNQFLTKPKKNPRKKLIYIFLSVLFLMCLAGVAVFSYLTSSESSSTDNIEIEIRCSPDEIIASRELIDTNYVFDNIFLISGVNIQCLGRESFAQVNFTNIFAIGFYSSNIAVIEKNTFGNGEAFFKDHIIFSDVNIGLFQDQNFLLRKLKFESSEVETFPNYFPVKDLSIRDMTNFVPSREFVNFLSSSSKENLELNGIFDEQGVINFKDILLSENKIISLSGEEESTLTFESNTFSTMPNHFFAHDVFVFNAPMTNLVLESNDNLVSMPNDIFQDFSGENVSLSFRSCGNLRTIPTSISQLDLYELNVGFTAVKSLPEINFSLFTSLESLYIRYSPIEITCEEESSFRETYSILENVYIDCVETLK